MEMPSFSPKRTPASQSGVMLIEVMIAILIFALGVLGIVSLQAASVSQISDAKYRSDASFLANQLFATMWVGDRTATTLQSKFNTNNPDYMTWKNKVTGSLPGVASKGPEVVVANDGTVTVTIYWLPPSAPAGTAHNKYVAVAQIK